MHWPENINSTWNYWNDWAGADVTKQLRVINYIPATLNTITILLLTLIDFRPPRWLQRYQIQDKKDVPIRLKTFVILLAFWLFNKFLVSSLFAPYFLSILSSRVTFGPLPTIENCILQFILICFIEDAYFYYVHRLTHEVKWFYKWVHYVHHKWMAPTALSISYMHPIEWVMVNMSLVYVGPVIVGAHAAVVFVYYSFIFTKGVLNHSGYHLPLPHVLSSEFHDNHHRLINCNYGSYGIFDYLHGTIATSRANPPKFDKKKN